ncbi:YbgF trimerization domain-containing protein [Acinetobacter junii]|jgi:TolA-binding protein|uniref:YbgF trimerization domain-containing protein n=1 Tax=Acinetobacter junii TaxID=40215 RepID=UPI000F661A0F|nr:YbgF trimerization domain-containing protein [Acinetobacter junii]MBQ1493940.1 tetratricopeptide repeat protein [Acinetobacter sp.]MDA3507789.1 tetratricopeptide repeat protein [Acinetobacter junii]MDA3532225.1 tetratricopeptide repeat protein [Acinetobacter junii]MDH0667453.1 tetratricopeptide repeat protein [Acinetobacter junii]MDH1004746.1 tetratricopeptide repeat protein [Acinetobacter junii]
MLKKHSAIFIALLSSTHLYANIPIESRALSQQFNDNTTSAPVSTNLNWDLIQKNQKLEEEVRRLRGQLEEHENSIELLKKELANRYTDLDQRLELLSQKIDPPEETTEATTESTAEAAAAPKSEPPSPANTIQPDPPKNTTNSTSTPVVQATQNTATTNTTNAQIELEKAAYTVALDAYKQGGAKKAIQPMQNFIKNHPNGIYVGNAYFWLAEFYLAVEPVDYKAAKQNYNIVATRYPNSAKAPRAIYQLYSIAKEVDKNTALANQYKNKLISQYPQTEEAKFIQKK